MCDEKIVRSTCNHFDASRELIIAKRLRNFAIFQIFFPAANKLRSGIVRKNKREKTEGREKRGGEGES